MEITGEETRTVTGTSKTAEKRETGSRRKEDPEISKTPEREEIPSRIIKVTEVVKGLQTEAVIPRTGKEVRTVQEEEVREHPDAETVSKMRALKTRK